MDQTLLLACVTRDESNGGVLAAFSLVSAIVTCLLAPNRGRSAFWWFLIGGFLPWVSILILYPARSNCPMW